MNEDTQTEHAPFPPVPVQAHGQDHPGGHEGIHFTELLDAAQPVAQLLGRDYDRLEARVLAVDGPLILAQSKEMAEALVNQAGVTPSGGWLPQGLDRALRNCDEVWAAIPLNATVPVTGQASQQITGSQTTPTAGQVIAQITGLAAGLYTVQWTISIGGTTSGTEADNFALNVGATQELVSMNGSGSGTVAVQATVQLQVPANGTVDVTAIANGTAASVYRAQLVVTQVSGAYTSCRASVAVSRRLPVAPAFP